MKPVLKILITAFCLSAMFCAQFPTQYTRIEENRIRTLDFMYDPPEAAPGDTVRVSAVFAGKSFDPLQITWKSSFRVAVNTYGVVTPVNEQKLDILNTAVKKFSENTVSVQFSFVIPEDVIISSPVLNSDMNAALLENMQKSGLPIPAGTPSEFASFIQSFADQAPRWAAVLEADSSARQQLAAQDPLFGMYNQIPPLFVNTVCQMFSVPVLIYGDVPGSNRVRSQYTVRFNSRFAKIPGSGVFVNNNPVIDSIGVYEVSKYPLFSFDPEKDSLLEFTYYTIPIRKTPDDTVFTLTVKPDVSYFVRGFSGNIDSTLTIDATFNGKGASSEDQWGLWYFKLDNDATQEVSATKYMNIVNLGTLIEQLIPPADERINSTTLWLEVYDDKINELYRPRGSDLEEREIRFVFTDEYLKKNSSR